LENGQELELRSSRGTVATALRDVGIRIGPGDLVQPSPDSELSAGLQVRVQHASEVVVTLPEGKSVLYTLDGTVGDAMANSGIALPGDYRLDPPEDTLVSAGMSVHVIAVSEEQEIETERIESETVYEPDDSLPFGEHRVVQGQDGVHYRRYSLVYENGEIVSRALAEEWDDPVASNTVVYYSTADAPPSPAPDGASVARVLRVYATWYNPASSGRPPSDPSYGLTATGVPVTRGIVAVDPSVIPLGTKMTIPGYGEGVAADTGGAIVGARIDLWFPTRAEALAWGTRTVSITLH
jgi:3D (Asp-Asp-Asp) domain-containing protein